MKKFKIIMMFIIFIIVFIFLNMLVKPKYMDDLIEGNLTYEYYDELKNHEVIFLGDCEVYANYSPMKLYSEYGINSYIRGNSQQLIWQSYGLLKETLKYEKPKIVIFNVNSMRYSEPVSEAYNRLMLDKMKWSKEKIEMINDSMLDNEDFISYVFPLLRYHSRYSELNKEDFKYLFKEKKSSYNGFIVNKGIKPNTGLPNIKKLSDYRFSDRNYDYLNKIVSLCKDNGIKLILVKAPSLYPYWYKEYDDQIKEFALSNRVDYYNFINYVDNIGIDYNTDTYDAGLHLNLYGAEKLSNYFGKILVDNYDLKDYRLDSETSKIYNEKLKKYYEEF